MARAQIQRLLDQSGGFGAYLFMGGDFASPEATLRSATSCSPARSHRTSATSSPRRQASDERVRGGKGAEEVLLAVAKAVQDYEAEKARPGRGLTRDPVPLRITR